MIYKRNYKFFILQKVLTYKFTYLSIIKLGKSQKMNFKYLILFHGNIFIIKLNLFT